MAGAGFMVLALFIGIFILLMNIKADEIKGLAFGLILIFVGSALLVLLAGAFIWLRG